MTHQAAKAHRQNSERLDRQLAIAGDGSRPDHARRKAARWAAALAEKLGLIDRPRVCEWCRRKTGEQLERHHADYRFPLHVLFLCTKCHEIADRMKLNVA